MNDIEVGWSPYRDGGSNEKVENRSLLQIWVAHTTVFIPFYLKIKKGPEKKTLL